MKFDRTTCIVEFDAQFAAKLLPSSLGDLGIEMSEVGCSVREQRLDRVSLLRRRKSVLLKKSEEMGVYN
jgi:hypothetical protein